MEERGHGGMAVVYKAYDQVLQRTVALKILAERLASDEEFTKRLHREAITAANLRHPNIVVIYDVGVHENYQYIVMEYLLGQTLQQEIQQKGVLPMARVMSILAQLADALDYAHQQGVVHRDVKSANIIVSVHDYVTLTDFGLAKAIEKGQSSDSGVALGTLKYMSPEQALGKELDCRSDVYSLGVVVYEMLVGEVPFTGTTPYEALHGLIYEPPPPLSQFNPHVDPKVEQAVLGALAKDPDKRFDSASQFAQALAAAAGLRPAMAQSARTERLKRDVVLLLTASDERKYPAYRGEVTLGRDTGNDIVIPVYQVSRYHARLNCSREGCWVVDLNSTNGTFINGMRLPAETPRFLRPGDVLGVGPVNLLVSVLSPDQQGMGKTMSMGRKPD